MKVTITVTVIIGTIFISVFTYFSRRWITKRRGNMVIDSVLTGNVIFCVFIRTSLTLIL